MSFNLFINYQKKQSNGSQTIHKIQILQFYNRKFQNQEIKVFQDLQHDQNFFNLMKKITKTISDRQSQFVNTAIFPIQQNYFKDIRARFSSKNLQVPFILQNFIHPKDFFQKKFNLKYETNEDLAKFFGLRVEKFANQLFLLRNIFQKFHIQSHLTNSNCQHSLVSINVFSFYRIQVLDTRMKRKFIEGSILNGCIQNQFEVFFLSKSLHFSGYLILKVVGSYQNILFKKVFEQKDRIAEVKRIEKKQFYDLLQSYEANFDNYELNSRRLSSEMHRVGSRSRQQKQFKIKSHMQAIRIRGLPYIFNQRDIWNVFQYYQPIKDSIRLGYRRGKRSGEAVLAFQRKEDALNSLKQDRQNIMGRYLQIKLSTLSQYQRFS